jgi:hypothetical protein
MPTIEPARPLLPYGGATSIYSVDWQRPQGSYPRQHHRLGPLKSVPADGHANVRRVAKCHFFFTETPMMKGKPFGSPKPVTLSQPVSTVSDVSAPNVIANAV